MNPKFYGLSQEKQDRIINAGLEVFAKNAYKKAPMSEIAGKAGISKSLLFHYFKNKKELYFFLYHYALEFSLNARKNSKVWEETDFIEIYRISLIEKCQIFKRHKYLYLFFLNTYYEEDPELQSELMQKTEDLLKGVSEYILQKIDCSKFKDGVDVKMMLRTTIWTADGYMRGQMQKGNMDPDRWEEEFLEVIDFWRKSYYKEEYL